MPHLTTAELIDQLRNVSAETKAELRARYVTSQPTPMAMDSALPKGSKPMSTTVSSTIIAFDRTLRRRRLARDQAEIDELDGRLAQQMVDLLRKLPPAARAELGEMLLDMSDGETENEPVEDEPPPFPGRPGGKMAADRALREVNRRSRNAEAFARRFPAAARVQRWG